VIPGRQGKTQICCSGARTNQTHFAPEHINELRQLIKFPPTEVATQPRNSVVADGSDDHPAGTVGNGHGSELHYRKQVSDTSHTFLQKEYRATGRTSNCDGDYDTQR
jgi:hypothetical protein